MQRMSCKGIGFHDSLVTWGYKIRGNTYNGPRLEDVGNLMRGQTNEQFIRASLHWDLQETFFEDDDANL